MKLFKKPLPASADYTQSMLPHNRKQVFFDVLKLQWKQLILMGLVVLLFCLPMAVLSIFEQVVLSSLLSDEFNLTAEQIAHVSFSYVNTYELIRIPCFLILFVGLSGVIKVIRQYAWEENVFFKYDFANGLKSNIGYMSLLAVIVGIASWISVFCANQVSFVDNTAQSVTLFVPLCLFVLLVLPIALYAIVAVSIYNVKFSVLIKIALVTYAKRPIKTLLALICFCLPFVLLFIPNVICNIIGWIVCPILAPILLLAWFLVAFDNFDVAVNKQSYPSLVGKGLVVEENVDDTKNEVNQIS